MDPALRQRYRTLILAAGWMFVILGVLGLFLPILQGVLFLMVGFYLLSLVSPRARLLKMRVRKRFPKAARWQDEAEAWVRRKLAERQRRKKS